MASGIQRFMIVIILLFAFTGRIAIYALPLKNLLAFTFKSTSDSKSTPLEKEDPLVEKLKLADLIIPAFSKFDFLNDSGLKNKLFKGDYTLLNCDSKIPEQPPK